MHKRKLKRSEGNFTVIGVEIYILYYVRRTTHFQVLFCNSEFANLFWCKTFSLIKRFIVQNIADLA